MHYIGYYDSTKMPFKRRQEIIIPKGAMISSMRPGQDPAPNKRARRIVINHFMTGQEAPAYDAVRYYRDYLEKSGVDVEAMIFAMKAGEMNPSKLIPVANPKVCWPGTGGYWCEIELNDVLAANGLDDTANNPKAPAGVNNTMPLAQESEMKM